MGQKQKTEEKKEREKNTPGTRGGPGGRDRRLTIKIRKCPKISFFSRKKMNIEYVQISRLELMVRIAVY